MLEDQVWRLVLLSVVFVTDFVVFIGLVREELRDWRAARDERLPTIGGHSPFGAKS